MTETESMVVRVAKEIAAADERNGGPPYEYRISLGKHAKEQLFDEARAAIEAFRRLPDHIWIALEQADAEAEWMDSAKAVRHLHDILIDKALEEYGMDDELSIEDRYIVEGPLRITPRPDGRFDIECLFPGGYWAPVVMLDRGELGSAKPFDTMAEAREVFDVLSKIAGAHEKRRREEAEFRDLNPPIYK